MIHNPFVLAGHSFFFQVFNFSGIERGIFSRNVFSRRNAEIRDKVVKDENFKPEV